MRYFKLLKETPELKEGALLISNRQLNGTADYRLVDDKKSKYPKIVNKNNWYFSHVYVEDNPDWYEELFPLGDLWLDSKDIKRVEDFLKGQETIDVEG